MKKTAMILLLVIAFASSGALLAGRSYAIDLAIRPVKVFLDAASGTEKLFLQNTSHDAFDLQIRIYAWSQDASGKDIYTDTSELVVFPKIFKVAGEEERMLRIGTKQRPGPVERCYRIYLEELPHVRKAEQGPSVRMLTRVGIPVFLAPARTAGQGKIGSLRLEKGKLTIDLKNEGTAHWPISNILVTGNAAPAGGKGFTKEIPGWYLLSGAARAYTVDIPSDACVSLKSIAVEITSEKYSLKGGLDVDKAMCAP